MTIRELLTPVFYYRVAALVSFLIPVAIAVVAICLAQPIYTAQSRLLILLGDDYVFRSDVDGAAQGLSFDRAQIVQAEIQILSAKELRVQAIRKTGLAHAYPALANEPHGIEKAAEQLSKDLVITNIPQSNVIELNLRNRDSQAAADLLNTLVKLYIERRRLIFEQSDLSLVNGQRDQLNNRLADVEAKLLDFSVQHGFGDYPTELATIQNQQASLASQIQVLDQQLAARSGRVSVLSKWLKSSPPEVEISNDRGRSQQLEDLTRSLLDLQNQRRQAAARYVEGYPLIVDLDRKIAEVQAQIRAAPPQQVVAVRHGVNPVRQQLDTELADSVGDLTGLRLARSQAARDLQVVTLRLAELVKIGPEYRELVRQRSMLEAGFADIAKRSQATGLADTLAKAKANVRIVQAADPPVKGSSGRMVLLLAGLAFGVVAAVTVIVVSAAFSDVMITPRDVEQKLDIPVVLTVSASEHAAPRRPPQGGSGVRSAFLGYDEAKLVLRLLSSVAPGPGRVLQLVAANGGEGVSSLLMDLAVTTAKANAKRVLLVDIEPSVDLSAIEVLAKSGVSLSHVAADRIGVKGLPLHVTLPMGVGSHAMSETQWETFFREARQHYDVILVDNPALERSSASLIVAPLVDMTLVVIEAEATRAAVARNMIERIESATGEVTGAILNKRGFYIPRAIYSWL
ncbi:hypothetical protein [Caulobacter sp.]|uniref:GumC family protein n=1 Tax=Caulobacter sp. TaxID=78 RepID=UPI002B4A01D4|nr:hypothetical protein [Caulobacter sp.]HJV42701.1 hypothetical protein [Caulobacter sp.]